MDPLTGLLDSPRARGAFVLRTTWSSPWGLRILAEAPLTVLTAARGSFWITPDDEPPIEVGVGDVVLTRGPDHYSVGHEPHCGTDIDILPGQRARAASARTSLDDALSLGIRTWGNDPDGDTVMLVGAYHQLGELGQRLMDALPAYMHLGPDDWDPVLLNVLASEALSNEPGQAALLDRLFDAVVVSTLRSWFRKPDTITPDWYEAYADPVVGPALRLMQDQPGESWTVASVASEVGVSRAVLARRFSEAMGQPPMAFLTEWRIDMAAELLRDRELTLEAIASRVGYASAFGLSDAFKRLRGMSPQAYRERI